MTEQEMTAIRTTIGKGHDKARKDIAHKTYGKEGLKHIVEYKIKLWERLLKMHPKEFQEIVYDISYISEYFQHLLPWEPEDTRWYAILIDEEDNDWGIGSYELEEAIKRAKTIDAYAIAVINETYDPICEKIILIKDIE